MPCRIAGCTCSTKEEDGVLTLAVRVTQATTRTRQTKFSSPRRLWPLQITPSRSGRLRMRCRLSPPFHCPFTAFHYNFTTFHYNFTAFHYNFTAFHRGSAGQGPRRSGAHLRILLEVRKDPRISHESCSAALFCSNRDGSTECRSQRGFH